eukprot:scaffold22962_cov64-Phaeocystis_antarctica.AAC.3
MQRAPCRSSILCRRPGRRHPCWRARWRRDCGSGGGSVRSREDTGLKREGTGQARGKAWEFKVLLLESRNRRVALDHKLWVDGLQEPRPEAFAKYFSRCQAPNTHPPPEARPVGSSLPPLVAPARVDDRAQSTDPASCARIERLLRGPGYCAGGQGYCGQGYCGQGHCGQGYCRQGYLQSRNHLGP